MRVSVWVYLCGYVYTIVCVHGVVRYECIYMYVLQTVSDDTYFCPVRELEFLPYVLCVCLLVPACRWFPYDTL